LGVARGRKKFGDAGWGPAPWDGATRNTTCVTIPNFVAVGQAVWAQLRKSAIKNSLLASRYPVVKN